MRLNSTHNAKYVVIDPPPGVQKFTADVSVFFSGPFSRLELLSFSCFETKILYQRDALKFNFVVRMSLVFRK